MCSSDNTLQLEAETECELMMFTRHFGILSVPGESQTTM